MDEKFLNKIVELQNLFDEGVLTTADKIDRPERALEKEAFDDFNKRNPMAGGGMLVSPSADGSRPGYSGPKLMKTGEHKGKYKFTVGRAPERVEYFDKIEDGEAWQKENRKRQGYDVEKGKKISMAEKNRAARNMFGKQYNELPAQGPKSQKVVYDRLYAQFKTKEKNPGKFRKKTAYTPLSKTNQAKIKKEFPNADFSKGKLGFATSNPEYFKVSQFIERGYKKPYEGGKFKSLTKYQQQELTKNFPEVEFDFDRSNVIFSERGARFSKYGVPFTHPKYSRIAKFFNEVKPIRYRFDLADAGGWMMAQMDRAALQGDKRYLPIKENNNKPVSTKNKIIGIETDGVKYTMKNIKDHPDYNNTKKYHNIAKKTSQKLIYDFENLAKLLPEGFDAKRIQLNDLLQFVANKDGIEGLNRAKRAIQIHHEYGVGKKATGGYQLLREDLNLLANKTTNLIQSGDPKKVKKGAAEALLKNTRLVIDNSRFGGEAVGPRKDVQNIVTQLEGEVKKFTKKDWNNFGNLLNNLAGELNPICRKKVAEGGRINFEYGSVACQAEAKKYVKESLAKGIDPKATDIKSNIVKKILRSTLNFAKGALDPKELLNLRSQFFSAGALASIPIFDGVIAADAAIRKGKPIQEALKDTLSFGFLSTPQNVLDAQKILDSATSSPAAKDYAQRILTANELERAKKDSQTIGVGDSFFAQRVSDLEQKLKGMEYNPETGLGGEVGKRDFESELANIKDKFTATPKKFDAPDKTGADSFFSGELKRVLVPGEFEKGPMGLPITKEKLVPAYTSNSYDTAKLDLPTEDFIGTLSEALGYERPSSEQAKEMINQERFRQLFETPGFTGTQERFNKGGIAGLSGGDKSGPPPQRGPNSEGLSSLLKRGTNI
jgi:hypothetical protein